MSSKQKQRITFECGPAAVGAAAGAAAGAGLGNQALIEELLQAQEEAAAHAAGQDAGSATVATGAETSQEAQDHGSYTQAILERSKGDESLSIQEVLAQQAAADSGGQQAGLLELGTQDESAGERHGVYIGNSDYEQASDLDGAKADAQGMQSTWGGRGYEGDLEENQTAPEMEALFEAVAGDLGPGDELIYYYAGHGLSDGVLGVGHTQESPDLLANARFSGMVGTAQQKGFHLNVILDSCHAGAVGDAVRGERIEALAEESGAIGALAGVARTLEGFKRKLDGTEDFEETAGAEEGAEETRGAARAKPKRGLSVKKAARTLPFDLAGPVAEYQKWSDGDDFGAVLPADDQLVHMRDAELADVLAALVAHVLARIDVLENVGAS